MQNPFTTTFSKNPGYSYIATEKTNEILENFSYENPSESVYKITGVRGSGKTVILTKVEEYLRNEENVKNGWMVFDINPARDMLAQFAAFLSKTTIKLCQMTAEMWKNESTGVLDKSDFLFSFVFALVREVYGGFCGDLLLNVIHFRDSSVYAFDFVYRMFGIGDVNVVSANRFVVRHEDVQFWEIVAQGVGYHGFTDV